MPLFHCKFEATIGGNKPNNENEANEVQPNNKNRQQENDENQGQSNNEKPDNPVNPDPENSGSRPPNNPENPDRTNRGNRHPNNPENPDRPNRGNRQSNNPDNPDHPNKENQHLDSPEFPDTENSENRQYNYQPNPEHLNPRLFSVASHERPKTLFIPRGGTAQNGKLGVTVDGRSLSTNKRPGGESTIMRSSKQQRLDDHSKSCTPKLVPGNELMEDHVRSPDLSLKPLAAPRNNERFFNPNRDITITPTIDAINEQVRRAGNYNVFNLSVRHRIHGEIMFLGSRDLSKLEADLSKLVQFCHGKFAIGPNIQPDPVLCTLNNISREDLAKQVSKTGGPPTNDELYRILTALSLVHNAKCWCYNENDKEWTFLTSSQKGNCKKGGQSSDDDADDDGNNSDDDDDEEEYFVP